MTAQMIMWIGLVSIAIVGFLIKELPLRLIWKRVSSYNRSHHVVEIGKISEAMIGQPLKDDDMDED